jgi:hypothetical protein
MVVHACNSSTQEMERQEDHKFKASLGDRGRSCLRKLNIITVNL